MIERLVLGTIADKPHTVLRAADGTLRYEECFTRRGFDGIYSIVYHRQAPTGDLTLQPSQRGWHAGALSAPTANRQLFDGRKAADGLMPLDSHQPLLENSDVAITILKPTVPDQAFLANNDGDDLYYFHSGSARVQTPFGELDVGVGDYLWLPRSLPYRFLTGPSGSFTNNLWLHFEVRHGLRLPAQYLNDAGQLRMDAPYSHRDFRRPSVLPSDDQPAEVLIKRGGRFYSRTFASSILDVIGLDGFVYPTAFNIERFQPKTGLVHLPPPVHATFVATGAVFCSFVPRLTDTHPQAIPCPYPHSSVDCDEFLFYCRGNFTSRRGVGPGCMSLHPAGLAHGPHPGAYEGSIGSHKTEELAVMLDTFQPLLATGVAASLNVDSYHASWRTPP